MQHLKKKTRFCIAPHSKELTAEMLRCGSHSFHTANTPHLALPVAIHQRAPLLCVVIAAIWLQLTTHLLTPRGWNAELTQLADPQRMVYPYKWLPISCRSGAGQWKFAGQRPTFYHWATPPTRLFIVSTASVRLLSVRNSSSNLRNLSPVLTCTEARHSHINIIQHNS